MNSVHHGRSDIILALAATPVPMALLRDELIPQYAEPLAAKATRDKLAQVFRELEALGIESTESLTPEAVARFVLSQPTRAPATIRGLLMSLRTICSYAEARRYVVVSPFRVRKLSRYVRVPRPSGKRHLSADEVRRLLDVMRGDVDRKRGWAQWRARRLYAATSLVVMTGVRRNECLCLWVEDLDLGSRTINLTPRGPKLPKQGDVAPRLKTEASAQPIAMPRALVPVLGDWLAHRLDHPDGFELPPLDRIPWVFPGSKRISAWTQGPPEARPLSRLKAAARRAGIADVSWQMLRRTWTTRAEALGMPQALITRQARHTDSETTRRWYQQRDLDALRGAVEGFDY